jgi:CRISPR/Cas system-associated exonuclease Cas4 (RecB family)
VTKDILSFKRCPRQYGFFAVKGFSPAHTTQLYFGDVIHQVLDLAHLHYKGLLDDAQREKAGEVPNDMEIEFFFNQVENALFAKGVKPFGAERKMALELLKKFNKLEGPILYPRVKETEYELKADVGSFVITGKVDVLIVRGSQDSANSQVEIWDYKGQKFPGEGSEFQTHVFQMYVYAELYNMRARRYPDKAVLYYINELDPNDPSDVRPPNAYKEIPIDKTLIDKAIKDFEATAEDIDKCKETDQWKPPELYDRKTCDACDIRWGCPAHGDKYPLRYP